jgi:hypothetical protein
MEEPQVIETQPREQIDAVNPGQPVSSEDEMMFTTQSAEEDLRGDDATSPDTELFMTAQQVSESLEDTSSGNNMMLIGGITVAVVLVIVATILLFRKAKS